MTGRLYIQNKCIWYIYIYIYIYNTIQYNRGRRSGLVPVTDAVWDSKESQTKSGVLFLIAGGVVANPRDMCSFFPVAGGVSGRGFFQLPIQFGRALPLPFGRAVAGRDLFKLPIGFGFSSRAVASPAAPKVEGGCQEIVFPLLLRRASSGSGSAGLQQ